MFYKHSTLPNGLQVITEHIPNVRSVALGMWVKFGSRDETDKMSGAAHFLEHMLFKGTPKRTSLAISEAFESLGAEFNAFSAKEYTAYHARFLDEHLPVALDILSDMLSHSVIDPAEFDQERQVIIEEIRLHEDMPDDQVHDVFMGALWPGHPLGRPVAGTQEIIQGMARDDLHSLYRHVYTPDRLVIAATGNVDHDKLIALLSQHLELGTNGTYEREPVFQDIEKRLALVNRTSEQAHIIIGGQGLKAHDDERFALLVLDCVLGGGMSSRLFQEIREKNGLAYSIYSHYAMYVETGYFSVYAGTTPARAKETVDRIRSELTKLAREGATEEEVYRCREHIKGQLVLSFESTANRMFRLGRALISDGELLSLDEIVNRIDSVTRERVNELAARLLNVDDLVLAVVGPVAEGELG